MKRGSWWPIGITAVLATTVAANVWVATIASDDPSFAIEPDYYAKAIAWDSTLAQARTNATLGWRLTPSARRDERACARRSRTRPALPSPTPMCESSHCRLREPARFIGPRSPRRPPVSTRRRSTLEGQGSGSCGSR